MTVWVACQVQMLHHFQSSLLTFLQFLSQLVSFISYNVCDYRDNPDVPFLSGTRDHIEMRDLEIRVIRILMLVLH